MTRNSKKCEREEAAQKALVKKAIEKGNSEMARIYATNAIRKHNEALNLLRMSARLDAVASQISSACTAGLVCWQLPGRFLLRARARSSFADGRSFCLRNRCQRR